MNSKQTSLRMYLRPTRLSKIFARPDRRSDESELPGPDRPRNVAAPGLAQSCPARGKTKRQKFRQLERPTGRPYPPRPDSRGFVAKPSKLPTRLLSATDFIG